MADPEGEVEAVLVTVERDLQGVSPEPFSPKAFRILKLKVADHVRALVLESGKISRRHRSDVISAYHVEQADEHLVTGSTRRWPRHVGTVGGILLGASLSNFLSMMSTQQFSTTGVAVSAVLAIAGAFGVAFNISGAS